MKKNIQVEQIEKALAITRNLKIGIQGNFIFGDPAETLETAAETLSWWEKHAYYHINMTPIIPYPGSEDYKLCVNKKIIGNKIKFIEQGCPSVNMTELDKDEYSSIFQKISEYIYRQRTYGLNPVTTKKGFDEQKNVDLYRLKVKCPHCLKLNFYNNFHQTTPGTFKVACRFCNQRFDLHANIFSHIQTDLGKITKILLELQRTRKSISVTPCVSEYVFLETMENLNIDWQSLNIKFFLDANPKLGDLKYMNKYPVLCRTRQMVAENCKSHVFIVLPAYHKSTIVKQLNYEFGLPKDRIIQVGG
jgi:hypothetical protein